MKQISPQKLLFRERTYELASLIAIKYGGKGDMSKRYKRYKPEYIYEFWKYGPPYPHLTTIAIRIKTGVIKWFIHNKLNYVSDSIWNPDFLMGLMNHGKLNWNVKNYPSFKWNNDEIKNLILKCPYGGIIGKNKWINVPALYLKYSEDSISYIAGVMAGAKIEEVDGYMYASFNKDCIKHIIKCGIPVDRVCKHMFLKSESKNRYLISPIWPALFSIKMPEEAGNKWLNIKKAYGVDCYAPILWRVYVDGSYPKGGIPYLKSKRTIFYQNECEEGATKKIERMRVEKGMTEMDNKVKEIVQLWAKRLYNKVM